MTCEVRTEPRSRIHVDHASPAARAEGEPLGLEGGKP